MAIVQLGRAYSTDVPSSYTLLFILYVEITLIFSPYLMRIKILKPIYLLRIQNENKNSLHQFLSFSQHVSHSISTLPPPQISL